MFGKNKEVKKTAFDYAKEGYYQKIIDKLNLTEKKLNIFIFAILAIIIFLMLYYKS